MSYPSYPAYQAPPPPRRKSAAPWLILGAVVVVAALVVTLVLTLSGDDEAPTGGGVAKTGGEGPTESHDLSSPEAAAESFGAVARSGNADELLKLTCLGNSGCVGEHVRGASQSEIDNAKDKIRSGVDAYGRQLEGAEFGKPRKGSEPGTMEVPYTRPGSSDQAFMIFIQWDGKWLWYGGGAGGPSSGGPRSGRDGTTPTR